MYEFTAVPDNWKGKDKKVDEIWVPSRFAYWVFVKAGFDEKKLIIVPEPIDVYFFDPNAVEPIQLPVRHMGWKAGSNYPGSFEVDRLVAGSSSSSQQNNANQGVNVIDGDKDNAANAFNAARQGKAEDAAGTTTASPTTETSVGSAYFPKQIAELRRNFKFLSVFKWESRKAWDILMKAFFAEFTADDHVSLYCVAYVYGDNGRAPYKMVSMARKVAREEVRKREKAERDARKEANAKRKEEGEDPLDEGDHHHHLGEDDDDAFDGVGDYGSSTSSSSEKHWPAKTPHLEIISEKLSEEQMVQMYRSVDAFVIPTRGEGWGLPIIQAMAMGLPTIATNWSGEADFMNAENSFPLEVESLDPLPSGSEYGTAPGKFWATPKLQHLRELMRKVYSAPDEARKVGLKARQHIVENYSDEAIAALVQEELKRSVKRKLGE